MKSNLRLIVGIDQENNPRIFLLSDGNSVIVYNYDGRQLSDIKPPGNGLGLISILNKIKFKIENEFRQPNC